MLPKKRKFTPADYDRFVVGSTSHAADEDNNAEEQIKTVQTSTDDRISVQKLDDSRTSEEGTNNNNGSERVSNIIYHPGDNEQRAEGRRKLGDELVTSGNEQETVGIDLSKRRHNVGVSHSPLLSPPPPQQVQQYSASTITPLQRPPCTSRRSSSSIGEQCPPSSLPERCTEDLDSTTSNRQQPLPPPQQVHCYMSSPITSVQYSTRNTTGISTPIPLGQHNAARPRSAASDVAPGGSYCRLDRIADGDHNLEGGTQFYPSPSCTGVGAGGNLHVTHPNNPSSSVLRLRTDVPSDIDLSDWVGHRILARRLSRDGSCHYYWPGVIQSIFEGDRVSVSLDGEESPLIYDNVLSMARCAIVSDVVPSTSQVSTIRFFVVLFNI